MVRAWVALAVLLAPALPAGAQQLPLRVPPHIQERRLEHRVPPEYPEAARRARIEGAVRLAVLIGEDGQVRQVRRLSGHPLLAVAAMDAVKRWRYRPATWRGAPVPVVTTVEVRFPRPLQERDLRKRVRAAGAIFSVAYW